MTKIKQKSNFNIDAAEMLIDKTMYAPSVHCAYYSCFQLLKYTIKDFFGKDYDTQSNEINKSKQKTHQYVINYIYRELVSLTDIETSRGFKNKIKDLQQIRVESDYHDTEIDINKGTKALNQAKEIRAYITSNF